MPDPKHLELLLDCDRYLDRQQVLLDRLAGDDRLAPLLAAMDAAFDQLLQAVTEGWRTACAQAEPPRKA
ncbi:hypothetical protein [Symbioplanes lichenis]|uniref:hypothetical protein n=1 Tax=Symbioplanes lichenis TaxID=1629072 RepID=UPI0027394F22|nr:hypothetical protein [Actinoplanes lichenis]